jgi:hypothetical protein
MSTIACCKSTVVVRCNGASCNASTVPICRGAGPRLHFVALRPIERGEVRY